MGSIFIIIGGYMKYRDLVKELEKIKQENNKMYCQLLAIDMADTTIICQGGNDEMVLRYGISELWKNFSYEESKTLFFIEKFIDELLLKLKNISKTINLNDSINTQIALRNTFDSISYYFDSIVSSFGVIIDSDRKSVLLKYLKNDKGLAKNFPDKINSKLWWEIYMLRNRIMHFSSGKYTIINGEAARYTDFSSKLNTLIISSSSKLYSYTTLLDINKLDGFEKLIEEARINNDINPFDILFDSNKAKGYKKDKPILVYLGHEAYYDIINSTPELIKQIHNVFEVVNNSFMQAYLNMLNNKEEYIKNNIGIILNKKEHRFSVSEVFEELEDKMEIK